MKLIGYFDGYLTVAEIQEISTAKSYWAAGIDYDIRAKATSGAETRIYGIRPVDDKSERGYCMWKTVQEANEVLENLLINTDLIDLRSGDFYCFTSTKTSDVRIENAWDNFADEQIPILVRIEQD